jgi:hypothetical protein
VLSVQFGLSLSLRDFCTEDKDESGSRFFIQPLQVAEGQGQDRLMVVTCSYELGEKKQKRTPAVLDCAFKRGFSLV